MTLSLPSSDNAAPGLQSGTVDVQFNSQAVNGSGLGTTSLNALNKTVTVSAKVYRVASVNSIATPVNLGIIHPNGSFASQALTITNTAANDGFSEGLDGSVSGITAGASSAGSVNNLAAGSSSGAGNQIIVGLGNTDTSTAGHKAGTVDVGFSTVGSATSGLPVSLLNSPTSSQTVTVTGQVNDYASPAYNKTAGVAFLTPAGTQATSYTLDFGTQTGVVSGSATLSLENLLVAADPSFQDSLGGNFSVTSGAGTFQLSGFNNIGDGSAIAPDSSQDNMTVAYTGFDPGTYAETITFTPDSTTDGLSPDASIPGDSSVALNITLTVNPSGVPEPGSLALLGLGAAALLRRRRRR